MDSIFRRMEVNIYHLPSHILIEIFSKVGTHNDISRLSRVCRQWRLIAQSHKLWEQVYFEEAYRITLKQLTGFVNSPYATGVQRISIEGYVIRRPESGAQSALTSHVLSLMGKKMPKLKNLRIWNANICNLNIKSFPKSVESLSFEGCIVECNFLADLCRREVLPRLKNLDLNYVHNVSSYSGSFDAILKKKGLESLQLRHCYKVQNRELSKLAWMPNLKVLNLSEIASVNDFVLKTLSLNNRLTELYLAFTVISDVGIASLCERGPQSLKLLDIRGCPKVTSISLHKLDMKLRLREIWISGKMTGAEEARRVLGTRILDEVDLKKMTIRLDLSNYSVHFADVMEERQEGEVVEDSNPIQLRL